LAARTAELPQPRAVGVVPAEGAGAGTARLHRLPPQPDRVPLLPGEPRRPETAAARADHPHAATAPAHLPVQRRPDLRPPQALTRQPAGSSRPRTYASAPHTPSEKITFTRNSTNVWPNDF